MLLGVIGKLFIEKKELQVVKVLLFQVSIYYVTNKKNTACNLIDQPKVFLLYIY